jgi:hypothetical protein
MSTFNNDMKKLMEEGIKDAKRWINFHKDMCKFYEASVKTYKELQVVNNLSDDSTVLKKQEAELARAKNALKEAKAYLARLLEDYQNNYGKKEALKLRAQNMGLKVIQGKED